MADGRLPRKLLQRQPEAEISMICALEHLLAVAGRRGGNEGVVGPPSPPPTQAHRWALPLLLAAPLAARHCVPKLPGQP